MALVRYKRPSLWDDFFSSNLQSFFEDSFGDDLVSRNMEVSETDKELVVKAPVYGIDPKDVEVNVKNNVLTIKGEAEKKEEKKDEDEKSITSEMRSSFYYQTALPREVDDEKAKAKVKNGVVTVTIPKSERSKGRRIEVEAE